MLSIRNLNPLIQAASRGFATVTKPLPSHPHIIRPSLAEQQSQRLNSRNLEQAVRHVHRDGLVVVEDAVSLSDLDSLNKKMVQDARVLQARGEDGPFNYNLGNLQQDAPPVAEFFSPSVFTSKNTLLTVAGLKRTRLT